MNMNLPNYKKIILTPLFLAAFGVTPISANAAIAAPLTATTAVEIQIQIQQIHEQIIKLQKQIAELQKQLKEKFNALSEYKEITSVSAPSVATAAPAAPAAPAPPVVAGGGGGGGGGGGSSAVPAPITPSITVLSPNGGETWTVGSTQTIKWNSTGFNYVLIDLIRGDGASGSFTSSAQSGQFILQIPSSLSAGNDYKIRVMGIDSLDFYNEAGKSDLSDNYFSIVETTTTLNISLSTDSPSGVIVPSLKSELLRVNFASSGEDIRVKSLKICAWRAPNSPAEDSDIAKISLYEGATQIGSDSYLMNGCASFAFPDFGWVISNTSLVSLAIKGDISNSQANALYLTMDGTDIVAEGVNSCLKISVPGSVIGNTLVLPQPSITVISPNGGETWTVGSTQTIKWSSFEYPGLINITLANPGGSYRIAINAVNTGAYSWVVGKRIDNIDIPAGTYRVYVSDNSNTNILSDVSDDYFSIVSAPTTATPSITINSSPQADSNGNLTIKQGDKITITGVPSNLSGQMIVDYTRAFFFDPIFNNSCSNTEWVMTCAANQIGTSNFYIQLYKGGQTYQSNIIKVTVVASTPSITVLSPNGGETLIAGETIPFSWQWTGNIAPLEPAVYLYSVALGQTIYGSIDPSSISYNPGADKQTGNLDALLYYPNAYPPGFTLGGQYKIKVCEYPENTNNTSYPSENPLCDLSDDYFSIIEAEVPANPYPGFLMTADKPNYVKGDDISLTIQRVDGKDFSYYVNVDAIEINTTPERRFTIHQKLDVSSPQGKTIQIDTSLTDPFLNGANGVYILLISAYGEEMIGGVNTNSTIVNYSDIPNPDSQ
ncbi:MAG: hypothetical protein V1739_07105 [Candidatus Omnitrophota bacterium]